MEKPLIYITRKIPDEIITPFKEQFHFRMWEKENVPVPRDTLLDEVKNADGVLCLITEKIDGEMLEHAPSLKVIANMAVGFDNIDVGEAKNRGIVVTNTPDVLTETTADLAFALLMATARRIVEASDYIRNNEWENWSPYALAGSDIYEKTIGIVGMGRIGEALARRAKGFAMKILYQNRDRKKQAEHDLGAVYTEFNQLLTEADFIVSVVPLTDETKNLFDELAFSKMKSSATFINVSRGQVVDEKALINALHTGRIKAAGLDVFDNEPIKSDHPLLQFKNVVCLPHIGSATEDTRTEMLKLCMENIQGVFYKDGPITPIS